MKNYPKIMARNPQKWQKEKKTRSKHTPQYEDFKDVVIDARKFLKGNKDVDLDSELEFDDEELDSDEAWGEDEYDVLDNTFSQTTRDQRKKDSKSSKKSILKSKQFNEYGGVKVLVVALLEPYTVSGFFNEKHDSS